MSFSILGNENELEEVVKTKKDGRTIESFESAKEYGETSKDLIKRWENGGREIATYVNGVKEGTFEVTYKNGDREIGTYVNGKKEGEFTIESVDGNKLTGTYENGLREGKFVYEGLADYKHNKNIVNGVSELSIFGTAYNCYAEGNYIDGLIEGRVEYYYFKSYDRVINKIISNYINGVKEGLEVECKYNLNSDYGYGLGSIFNLKVESIEIKENIIKSTEQIIRRTNYVNGEVKE